jgi:hypothetical protein
VNTKPLLAAAVCAGLSATVLSAPGQAQLTHHTWNGSQSISWMGFAVESIHEPNGDRRLLIAQPRYDHLVGFSLDEMAGAVRCYAGTNAGGAPLFQVFGGDHDQIGRSLAGLGDIDGDHYEDFAIGAPRGSISSTLSQEGYVRVCSGKTGATLFMLSGPQDYSEFGTSVAGPGDVNGDGKRDILVGAPEYDLPSAGTERNGRVYVYSGANGALVQVYTGNADSTLGFSVAGVGDVDGDGRQDFAAGAPEDDTVALQCGRVVVVRGGAGTVWKNLYGDSTQDDYGFAIAGGGDCNDDGVEDLIVGSPGESSDRGLVEVLAGPSFNTTYKLVVSNTVGDHMGASVDFAGDVDGDGYDDFIMGASGGLVGGSGKVYGRSGKTGATIIPAPTGLATGDGFGTSIAGVGDADGDGWDDVLVGAPFSDLLADQGGSARLIGWQVVQPDVGGGGVGTTKLGVFGAALATGYTAQIQVTGGPANAPAWLVASALQLALPFKGGVLVPNVNAALFLPFPTDAQGEASTLALGGGGPFPAYVQLIVQDAAQPNGWQLTHCVQMNFLP